MISFIVIGRNEAKYLSKCFNSIITTIEQNNLRNYEIIYVDSNSEDNNIEISKSFLQIKIYQLTADYNAAIARNLGAEKSTGDILFFIDGDMEIESEFLEKVYSEEIGLKYNFVSGDFLNINYDYSGKYLNKERYFKNQKVLTQFEVGGLFLIKREYWYSVGGMKNIFKRSQDIDFALRLAKKDIFLKRLPLIAAFHHTISYRDYKRKWEMIVNKCELFSRSLLYRMNVLNRFTYKRILFHDYSLVTLLLALLMIFLFDISAVIFLSYFIVIMYRSVKNKGSILNNILYYIIRDIQVTMGFILFFPKEPKNINYVVIK